MNRLKKLRKERNLTVTELSHALNIPQSTLTNYENEKRTPKQETWEKIAEFFGVSVAYLMGISDSIVDIPSLLESIFKESSDMMKEIVLKNDKEISEAVAFSIITLAGNFEKALDDYKNGDSKVFHDLRYIYRIIFAIFQGEYADVSSFESLKELHNDINEKHIMQLSTEEKKEKYDSDKRELIKLLDKYAFLKNS